MVNSKKIPPRPVSRGSVEMRYPLRDDLMLVYFKFVVNNHYTARFKKLLTIKYLMNIMRVQGKP